MPASNALNISDPGVISFDGTSTFNSSPVTQYSLLVGNTNNKVANLSPGAAGTILRSNGVSSNPAYTSATYPISTTINQILYSSAANTISGLATANNGLLITSAAGVPSILANGTTGQVLTATTGSPPSWKNTSIQNVTKTAVSYNILVTDDYVGVTNTAAARTMSLITTNYTANQSWIIKDESGGAATNNITITPSSGTIDGSASFVISSNFGSIQVIFDGTNYFVF